MTTRDVTKFLALRHVSLQEAMRRLDEAGERIQFIVDDDGRIVGSLTDGDIRRWILAGKSLTEPVHLVANPNPVMARESDDPEAVLDMMREGSIDCVPIVDDARRVTGLSFLREMAGAPHRPIKHPISLPVVIMAGGKGQRLAPFTLILPKALIPVGDKPVIAIIIERFRQHGIGEFYLSVNEKAKMIRAYFEDAELDCAVRYLQEEDFLGTAGSLSLLPPTVQGPLFVTNCDVLIQADYSEIYDFHVQHGNDITIVASLKHYRIPYGVCEIASGGALQAIREKPVYDLLVNTGMYVLESKLLELIPRGQKFDFTHLIDAARGAGATVRVFPVSERSWIDTGEWEEYRRAVQQLTL